jgi:LysM repeat protein
MEKRNTAPARVFATVALVGGCLVLVVVVANSIGAGSGGSKTPTSAGRVAPGGGGAKVNTPATYIVQNGDTLTSIAHKTGVSVARIEVLNPHVDPQILAAGEKLRLR